MDIISLLPLEMAYRILNILEGKDLWTCMAVSKDWRSLVNQTHIWKPLCLKIGVPPKKVEDRYDDKDELALCTAATEWRVQQRLISSWRKQEFTPIPWPKHEDLKSYAIHGDRLAVRTESKIHIYKIKNETTQKVDTINILWNCFFELWLFEMSSKYIIIGFNNVLIVYELNNTYFLKMAFTFNKDAAMATKHIYDFIQDGRNPFFVNILKIVKLSNDSLWVKIKYMYYQATYFHIDLKSGKATNVFPHRNVRYSCSADDVIMFREERDDVLLLTCSGANLICSLHVDQLLSMAGNDNMVAIASYKGLSTFEISSGENLANISIPYFPKYTTVNRVYDIVYCFHKDIDGHRDLFSSYCMRKGEQLWSQVLQADIPQYLNLNAARLSPVLVLWCCCLYGTFLIIKTGGSDHSDFDEEDLQLRKEYYVFDASSGELLYRRDYEKFLMITDFYLCDDEYLRSAI